MENLLSDPGSIFLTFFLLATTLVVVFGGIALLAYLVFTSYKHRNREKEALESTLIQIAMPRENEVKIDAAEQLFSSFAALHKGGRFSFLHPQPSLSFEIVGMPGDIRFYVSVPNKYKDFVEKQINGAYPDAEIREVSENDGLHKGNVLGNDYNIFSETAKVAFASLKLKSSNYLPIKIYKDLPTDPMTTLTSILAKMTEGEGA
ncbi:MAG: hypothetical protein AAB922_01250, partial [Patescibacteria group bacterium]